VERAKAVESRETKKDTWRTGVENTALVVIDMQRAFVDKGAPLECPGAEALVPGINEIAAACRRLRIPVIFVMMDSRDDLSDAGLSPEFAHWPQDHEMIPRQGRKGNEFCAGLKVSAADYVVPKIRYSAFIPGSSTLEPLLRGLGRDRFMICGVATDVCVGTTAMDGMMLGFKVFFVGDLTATFSEERQRIALEVYDRHFVKVVHFKDVMEALAHPATRPSS